MAALARDELDELEDLDEDLGRARRFQGQNAGTQKIDTQLGTVSKGKEKEEKENVEAGEGNWASDKLKKLGINNTEMKGVQSWVTQRDDENWQGMVEGQVCISVTHSNLKQKMLELRFDMHQTIGEVKARLHLHHGTPSSMQRLTLRDGGVDIAHLNDDDKMLGFYSATSGMFIHVVDVDEHSISRNGALENVNLVERYRMTDDDYDKRKGTVREYIKEQKAKDPNWKAPKLKGADMANQKTKALPQTLEDADHIVQALKSAASDAILRCEVQPGGRRGVVKFLGALEGKEGVWVGVELDDPLGKNDGSAGDQRCFTCPQNHGTFARPLNVAVGRYPNEMDETDSDEEI